MDKDVKDVYNALRNVIYYIQLLLKKEKLYYKYDELILKLLSLLNDDNNLEPIFTEIRLCLDENVESQKCLKEIKNYIKSLTKLNFSYKENMYYLLTADEYINDLLKTQKTRNQYIRDKYRQYIYSINGIEYYNPKHETRANETDKIKIYTNFINKTNPKNNNCFFDN